MKFVARAMRVGKVDVKIPLILWQQLKWEWNASILNHADVNQQ